MRKRGEERLAMVLSGYVHIFPLDAIDMTDDTRIKAASARPLHVWEAIAWFTAPLAQVQMRLLLPKFYSFSFRFCLEQCTFPPPSPGRWYAWKINVISSEPHPSFLQLVNRIPLPRLSVVAYGHKDRCTNNRILTYHKQRINYKCSWGKGKKVESFGGGGVEKAWNTTEKDNDFFPI